MRNLIHGLSQSSYKYLRTKKCTYKFTSYIIVQSPDISSPFCTGGKTESFLPCKPGFIDTGTNGAVVSVSRLSVDDFSFGSFDSSGSLVVVIGLVMFILIFDGAIDIVAGAESSSKLPSMLDFTAACVVSTSVGSILSSGSGSTIKSEGVIDLIIN